MTEKKLTQTERLEAELRAGHKLTGIDIMQTLHILNYKGRIHDLRRKGCNITTRMVKTSSGSEIAQYSLTQGQIEIGFKS